MSGHSDYQEYLVYRRPPGFQFNFPADKKFVWIKPDPKACPDLLPPCLRLLEVSSLVPEVLSDLASIREVLTPF